MEVIQQILIVFAVMGTLAGTVWVLRKKGFARVQILSRAGRPHRLELLERLPLTSQHSICLIRVDERIVTVALSPAGCEILPMGAEGSSS